ncbi:MAG: family 16 glycosylhydrolase [Spirochaetales bacterium]|nr:family 16 glycosylhydrolase [Spirochaetales bacterium]
MLKKTIFGLCLALLCVVFAQAQGNNFFEPLDSFNSGSFEKADGWTNGNPFNCTWRANNATFSGGIMSLVLNRDNGSPPYSAGEYRTRSFYKYGYYEVRMKAAKGSGTVSSFFTYTGPSDNNPWDEIDVEILGKNPYQMQTNYYTNGTGGHETMINLGFDASADFHVYGIEWQSNFIKWYVDGKLVHTENGSRGPLPSTASKIMMNFWPGIGVDGWLGAFDGRVPQYAYYDYFSYSTSMQTPVPETPTPEPNTPEPNTPTPTPTETPTPQYILGDVNSDNQINIVDALLIAQYYVGRNPSDFNSQAADVNRDNAINIVDALLIAQYYVGIIHQF